MTIVFKTLHKTGTNLSMALEGIIRPYCQDKTLLIQYRHQKIPNQVKGIFIYRHPFEVIASSVRYHRTTTESWACQPKADLKGKAYRQYLLDLPLDEAITIEMKPNNQQHGAYDTIMGIYEWDFDDPRFLNVKMEDFYDDFDGTIKRILEFLEINPEHHQKILKECQKHDIRRVGYHRVKHATNKSGKKHTYPDYLKPEHYQLFWEIFPEDILTKLGFTEEK